MDEPLSSIVITNNSGTKLAVVVDMSAKDGDATLAATVPAGDSHVIIMHPGYRIIVKEAAN